MSTAAQLPGQVVVAAAVLAFGYLALFAALLVGAVVACTCRGIAKWRRARHLRRVLDHNLETHVRNDPELAAGWGREYAGARDDMDWGDSA